MSKHKNAKRFAFLCIVLILVLLMLYSGLQILESTVFLKGQEQEDTVVSKTIERDGKKYFPRQDIFVTMVLGIDRYGPVESSGSYNNKGDADMVALLIFDETNETVDVLTLNRDSMVEMPILGLGGKRAGTAVAQLTLAHTYGSGLEDSCINVRDTLEMLFHGLHIDSFVSMHMDAISILNDAVGGVTVNVVDDFSDVDPTITMGETTLRGQQAITYVQTRKDVGDQKNVTRMKRQQEYLQNFLEAYRRMEQQDSSFIIHAMERVSPYIVTDMSVNTLSGIVERYGDYTLGRMITPEGENVIGQQYYEFYLDEAALEELTVELFYAPKK